MSVLHREAEQEAEVHYLPRPMLDVISDFAEPDDDGEFEADLTLPHLDPDFWHLYPEFGHIRDYAHHRAGAPESLLIATYARLSALVRKGTVVDTGMLSPVPLNFFAGLVGVSGRGKSAAIGLSRRFLPYTGEHWQVAEATGLEEFVERGLGSGEGIVEAFMGSVPDLAAVGPQGGRPPKIRKQVRHNALLTADEGGFLVAALQRQGSSLGALIREAWSADRMGQQNGSTDTSRNVENHCLGLIIGFQPRTTALLFGEADLGTPQRFFWAPTRSPWPAKRPDDPGPLTTWEPPAAHTVLRPPQWVSDMLWEAYQSDEPVPILAAQQPAMLLKLAGLTAVLCQRTSITDDDWCAAEALYRLNWQVCRALREHAAERQAREQDRQRQDRAATAQLSRHRADNISNDRLRVAAVLVKRIAKIEAEQGRGATRRDLSQALSSRDRHLLDAGLEYAVLHQSVIQVDGEKGRFRLGEGDLVGPRPEAVW